MPRRPARITKAELTAALRAPREQGIPLAGYEIDPNGTVRILFGDEPRVAVSTLAERCEASAQARRMARRSGQNR